MCYRPAVFFRHLHLVGLSLPQGGGELYILKMLLYSFFLCRIACLKLRNLKLLSGPVCNHSKYFLPLAYVTTFRRFCKIAKNVYQLSHFHPFVSPSAWNNLALTGRVFMKFDIWEFFENVSRKLKFDYTRTRIKGTLHEDQYAFLSYLAYFFLEWEMFQIKIVKNIKGLILCSVTFF
jgi:hypothetical protein